MSNTALTICTALDECDSSHREELQFALMDCFRMMTRNDIAPSENNKPFIHFTPTEAEIAYCLLFNRSIRRRAIDMGIIGDAAVDDFLNKMSHFVTNLTKDFGESKFGVALARAVFNAAVVGGVDPDRNPDEDEEDREGEGDGDDVIEDDTDR